MVGRAPRIIGVSALMESLAPARAAMTAVWPEADFHQLLDEALVADLATLGGLGPHLHDRIGRLARYAEEAHGGAARTDGVLFTCSAFTPAIEAAKARLPIPVVAPNEGAFEEALDICAAAGARGAVHLLVTFSGSLEPLTGELERRAAARGVACPHISAGIVDGALDALRNGDIDRHDALIAEHGAALNSADVTVLGQFSMARARDLLAAHRPEPVLTTPDAAARRLRRLVETAGTSPA